jgi:phosphoribosylformylglycinamidine synthase subunit PurL
LIEMPAWADGVRTVPLRDLSPRRAAAVARELGLGFDARELARIGTYFRREGRDPTDVELAALAQSWSEHCSYKSSRPLLRRAFSGFRAAPRVLGTGDAGVVRFPGGAAYALRIESHNHPSAVEPYGGAATGIGGILRDVLAVGARPIALTDPLFFGPLDLDRKDVPEGVRTPRYLAEGVVAGIRDYGNRVGVPTVSGGVYFDPSFVVNPLVNVGCVGFLPGGRPLPNRARARGDHLVLAGGLTGRDGIGGVAFASRELTDVSETESRGRVQLGNPILKEPLIHASLEAYGRGLVRGVKDLGGGGLAAASGELVNSAGLGLHIDLDRVPLREAGLRPWEVWISESQERMIFDVKPADVGRLIEIFRRYDVPATDVGEVTAGPYETVDWHGRPAAHLRVEFRVAPPPTPRRRAARRRRLHATPTVPDDDLGAIVANAVLAPDSASREPVIRVYDHEVIGQTVIKPLHGRVTSPSHGDAAVLSPEPGGRHGLAVTTAAQPWACREDPFGGSVWVVEEAARNLLAVGARPDAFSNCLNFGNPEDPHVMADFSDVTRGLAAGAKALGFVVPSGNVSFYNGGLEREIPPTPVLLATGLLDELDRALTSDLKESGDALYLLGPTGPELGGSLWARMHERFDIPIPRTNPAALRRLGERFLGSLPQSGVRAAHDVSDGGLAVALAEMAFGGALGFDVDLERTGLPGPGIALVAEGGSRLVVEVAPPYASEFERANRGTPCARIGTVLDGPGRFHWGSSPAGETDLAALYPRWRSGLGLP